jgi:hypothetical protein
MDGGSSYNPHQWKRESFCGPSHASKPEISAFIISVCVSLLTVEQT